MKNNKETKILQAAEKVFLKQGFYPARIDDIAKEAGVAKGTVYLYFKDKPSIYVALLNNKLSEAIKLAELVKNEKCTATDKLAKLFDKGFNFLAPAKGLWSIISVENINLTAEIMKKFEVKIKPKIIKIIGLIAQIIQEGIDNKEFKKIEPKMGAFLLLNILRTPFLAQHFIHDVKEHGEIIKDMFFYGIKPTKDIKNKKESK